MHQLPQAKSSQFPTQSLKITENPMKITKSFTFHLVIQLFVVSLRGI